MRRRAFFHHGKGFGNSTLANIDAVNPDNMLQVFDVTLLMPDVAFRQDF